MFSYIIYTKCEEPNTASRFKQVQQCNRTWHTLHAFHINITFKIQLHALPCCLKTHNFLIVNYINKCQTNLSVLQRFKHRYTGTERRPRSEIIKAKCVWASICLANSNKAWIINNNSRLNTSRMSQNVAKDNVNGDNVLEDETFLFDCKVWVKG